MSTRGRVVISDDGVSFHPLDGGVSSFRWADVAHVFVYRVNVGDGKVMAFGIIFDLHDGRYWEVHDRMDGFDDFVTGLASHLPLSHPDWIL